MEKPEIILQNLAHFNSSESLYTHTVEESSILYAEGVLYIAETCECYWLLDFMSSKFTHSCSRRFSKLELD